MSKDDVVIVKGTGQFRGIFLCILILSFVIIPGYIFLTPHVIISPDNSESSIPGLNSTSLMSPVFSENIGQVENAEILFYTSITDVWIGFETSRISMWKNGYDDVVMINFVASNNIMPIAIQECSYSTNIYNGEAGNYENIRSYGEIKFEGLWPGVDLSYKNTGDGVKYEFHIAPFTNPDVIQISLAGIDSLIVDSDFIEISSSIGVFRDSDLYVHQNHNPIDSKFVDIGSNAYGFEIGEYSTDEPLIIDPLIYSTFIGGRSSDWPSSIEIDSFGNMYVVGSTYSSDFPTVSPIQNNLDDCDCFILKLSADGSTLLFATYIGGADDDRGIDLVIDSHGDIWVTGFTYSQDFPLVNPYSSYPYQDSDVFVLKINQVGNLVYSTYIGGVGRDISSCIELDDYGNVIVVGTTFSWNFPTFETYYDTYNGDGDAFVLKLNPTGSSLNLSMLIGGSGEDYGKSIDIDQFGRIFLVGITTSPDFPTIDPIDSSLDGSSDCFISILSPSGRTLIFSTYLGGSSSEHALSCTFDSNWDLYVTGWSSSSNFPMVQPYNASLDGNGNCLIFKFGYDRTIKFSIFIGGTNYEEGSDIIADPNGNVYVTGSTFSPDFPTENGIDSTFAGSREGFLLKLNTTDQTIPYCTFIGGSEDDELSSLTMDNDGIIYVTGHSNSEDFSIVNGYSDSLSGSSDGIILKLDCEPATSSDFSNLLISSISIGGIAMAAIVIGVVYRKRRTPSIPKVRLVSPLETQEPVVVSAPHVDESKAEVMEKQVGILSGIDTAGEKVKIAIKVVNNTALSIINVKVILDVPDGLEYVGDSKATYDLGSIAPNGSFQSAIFWLRPLRCVDDSYGGIVTFADAHGETHRSEIPRKRLTNICPMLEGVETATEIFTDCKFGGLQRNSASFKFTGDPSIVFHLARTRISALIPVDMDEQKVGEHGYLAYTCVVGKTKYGDHKFAAEIQVSGYPSGGVLTIHVYSDDERILSGFFVDIMTDVREHIKIIEERSELKPTACPSCNAPLNLMDIDESRVYECASCGSRGKVPPWWD